MKLILSSCDFRNDNSKNIILHNLPLPIDKCRLLFIPNEKATFEAIHSDKFVLRMMSFGFVRENITVFDYYNADKYAALDIDILYISGGNTFATLKRLRECGFDKCVVKYINSGVTYIGGSAGAHIVSQNIAHLQGIDELPEDMTDFSGLGLFDGIFVCHYRDERKGLFEALKADGTYKVYAMTDDDSMVITGADRSDIEHYDHLIDENNDPVHDTKPL